MKTCLSIILLALLVGMAFADPLPEFRLPDETGKNVTLQDLLGKGPILLDFWADYCQPCKMAMPTLDALAVKYDSLTVVMVSLDAPKTQPKAKSYLKSKNYHFVNLFDADKTLATKLNVVNPPHTFIIDRTGEIVWSHLGYQPGMEKEYEHQIRILLGLPIIEEAVDVETVPETPQTQEGTKCSECPEQ